MIIVVAIWNWCNCAKDKLPNCKNWILNFTAQPNQFSCGVVHSLLFLPLFCFIPLSLIEKMFSGLPLVVLFILSVVLSFFPKREKLTIFWLLFSGIVHILLEGCYGFHNTEVTAPTTTTFMEKMMEDVPVAKAFDTHFYASLYAQYAQVLIPFF